VLTIEFGPAQDPKAFAAKIDFGTVTRIKGRLIELDADRKLMAEVVKFPPRPRAAKASTVASTALAAPVGDPPAFLLALPGADSAVPSWAGQAMDNPFDVRQFLQSRAAPADNAAPLYLAALADFGTEMDFCFRITEWEARKPSVEALSAAITRLADEDRLRSGFVRLEPDVAAGQPVDDRWAAISNHPAFLVAVVLAAILTRVLGWLVD
jgi:hypothetical protein